MTKSEILATKQKKQMTINYAASKYSSLKMSEKETGDRVPKGTNGKIIIMLKRNTT